VDATACLRPGNARGGSRVDAIEPRTNLGGPRRLGVGVHLAFEALNQLAGERGSLFVRQSKCFDEELFGVHIDTLARHSPPNILGVLWRREFQDSGDVVALQIRNVRQDLFPRRARGEELENVLHEYAAANAGSPTTDVRTHGDSIQGAHTGIVTGSV
jgi:hypothetical protein